MLAVAWKMQNWSAPVLNPVLNPLDQGAVDAYWDELSLAFGTAVRLARALLLTSFHRACLVIGLVFRHKSFPLAFTVDHDARRCPREVPSDNVGRQMRSALVHIRELIRYEQFHACPP